MNSVTIKNSIFWLFTCLLFRGPVIAEPISFESFTDAIVSLSLHDINSAIGYISDFNNHHPSTNEQRKALFALQLCLKSIRKNHYNTHTLYSYPAVRIAALTLMLLYFLAKKPDSVAEYTVLSFLFGICLYLSCRCDSLTQAEKQKIITFLYNPSNEVVKSCISEKTFELLRS